ncbi:MAG: lasso peptide biosynthesis B2 protein [Bryobacterales bacterium]|nr:lasso peptide biosynthesis B2 protein [Bryobacterales bacterium]
MNRLRRFARLEPGERVLVLRATLLVAAIRLGLWLLPFRALKRIMQRRLVSSASHPRFSPARLAWAVRAVSRAIPGATCLTQALALHYLLTRAGHTARVRIGVSKDAGRSFQAHAWVEHRDGTLLNTPAEVAEYTPITTLGGLEG